MRLTGLSARAHVNGNRIDLAWDNPDPLPVGYRLLIVRALARYPGTPDDGTVISPQPGAMTYTDMDLSGETVYYYTFFPFSDADEPVLDPRHRVAAMATAPYDLAGLMYGLLPEIYRRYDAATVLPERLARGLDEKDRDRGILRRFLDLPGGQLDQLYSMGRAALRLHDVERVDGALLPLLAQWIGWRTDHAATLAAQRNEIRFAPWVYRCTGTAIAVQATTARLTGRQCRIKEYVHNVALTNQPERLNLWTMTRADNGGWTSPELLSVNFAYDGRVAQVLLPDGPTLIYHTYRRHGFDIWAKRLTADGWSASVPVVDRIGVDKHPAAAVVGETLWVFWQTSVASDVDAQWRIAFRTRPVADPAAKWSDIGMFGADGERRAPAAVTDDSGGLWLFWRQRVGQRWQTRYNRYDGADWLPDDQVLVSESPATAGRRGLVGDVSPGRRDSAAVVGLGAKATGRRRRLLASDLPHEERTRPGRKRLGTGIDGAPGTFGCQGPGASALRDRSGHRVVLQLHPIRGMVDLHQPPRPCRAQLERRGARSRRTLYESGADRGR